MIYMLIDHAFVGPVFNEHCKGVVKLVVFVLIIQYDQNDQNRREEEIITFLC